MSRSLIYSYSELIFLLAQWQWSQEGLSSLTFQHTASLVQPGFLEPDAHLPSRNWSENKENRTVARMLDLRIKTERCCLSQTHERYQRL